jgi:hypothetical protein
MAGKGSRRRPTKVPLDVVDQNFETIFGKKEPRKQWVPPPLVLKPEPKKQGITFNEETKNAGKS